MAPKKSPAADADKKRTFMLHDPKDMSKAGQYTARTPAEAAKKAANKGHVEILLRETGTRVVQVFSGSKKPLARPHVVERKTRDGKTARISYTHAPTAKFERKFVWAGGAAAAPAAAPAQPKKRKCPCAS